MATPTIAPPKKHIPELAYIGRISRLMDSQVEVFGVRFGLDPIIGLVPVLGDIVAFGISGLLVIAAIRHGASGRVLFLMMANIVLDFLIGGIPIVGDIADFFMRTNNRNYRLLAAHYYESKHQGSARPYILGMLACLFGVFIGCVCLFIWGVAHLVPLLQALLTRI